MVNIGFYKKGVTPEKIGLLAAMIAFPLGVVVFGLRRPLDLVEGDERKGHEHVLIEHMSPAKEPRRLRAHGGPPLDV